MASAVTKSYIEVVQQFVLLLILAPLMKELHLYWSGLNTPGDALWRCSA